MDFGDIGLETTERITEAGIAQVRANARTQKFPVTGSCYTCEEASEGRPFCSKECREDYELAKKKITGRNYG